MRKKSQYFVCGLFFVFVQATVLFLMGYYLFNLPLVNLSVFSLAIFLTSSIFIFTGMSIAYLVKKQSLSMLLTIFFLMLLLIMSDLLSPSVLATPFVKFFINLNPFVVLNQILTSIIVLNQSIISVSKSLYNLGIFAVLTMLIAYLSKKVSKEDIRQ